MTDTQSFLIFGWAPIFLVSVAGNIHDFLAWRRERREYTAWRLKHLEER